MEHKLKNRSPLQTFPLIVCIMLLVFSSCRKTQPGEFTVLSGNFRQSIIESGELEAVNASYITMPRLKWEYGYRFKLIGFAEHGATVNAGDSVVALDPSSIYRYIIQREEMLENEMAAAKKQLVQMENTRQELQAQLRSELASYNLKKLELERIRFESDSRQRVKELEFEQASIRLEKVKRNLESKIRQEELDLKIQRIKVMQRESEIKDATAALQMLTIHSPNNGIFQVAQNRFSRQNTRLGDDLYYGTQIASIPDLSKMKVLSHVNEVDISKMKPGMKVIVRLDALPTVPFNGVLTFVSRICTKLDDKSVFLTEVEIIESDIRLKPGMTVRCEYISHEEENGIYVHNSCILHEDGYTWVVPADAPGNEKIEIITGPANAHHTLVLSDNLKPGRKLLPVNELIQN